MGVLRLRAAAVALSVLAGPYAAIPVAGQEIGGQWPCIWVDLDRGWEFECEMKLTVDSAGKAEGEIRWTMTRSPRPEDKSRIGLSGTEYVRGTFEAPNSLSFDGYAKDDPETVIGLDRYRLRVAHGGRWLYGPTWSHGEWTGRFFAKRP